jgi:DNA (cytosine-5)-methyltransferase 1
MAKPLVIAVDLFCGVGGLTKGLSNAGIKVVSGMDIDDACRFAYEFNNDASFYCTDISHLSSQFISELFPSNAIRVMAGCAPCQPFSRYGRGATNRRGQWTLLRDFGRIAKEVRPHIVTMENVPELQMHSVFVEFVNGLRESGFHVNYDVLYCPDFGIPQNRKRLVLLASIFGPIAIPRPTHTAKQYRTVRNAIGSLPKLRAGERHKNDLLHFACKLTDVNVRRIRSSCPGGTWRDWPKSLRANCHRAVSGFTYPAVYGRMEWDKPSPTITTQFFGYGNGRFGHPDQDRAISLREGALLQSFPKNYRFMDSSQRISIQKLGQMIGNAVPVRLGKAVGDAILIHIDEIGRFDV